MVPEMADAGLRVTAYSGVYMWYSGRGTNLNSVMSQDFPIPVGGATLTFMTWYDIQTHWDYGYVEVSTDGGFTWTTLEGNITTYDDPNGNNSEGSGITGKSGGWISASFDLSAFADQDVILRFRYETDASMTHAGWAIDDIWINEIGFNDDVEAGPGDWNHSGWNVVDDFLKTRTKDNKIGPAPAPRRGRITP
jgi:bacillopeptidase F (M6 metalloprotease family)